MFLKPVIDEFRVFVPFSLLLAVLNVFLCINSFKQIMWEIIDIHLFLFLLFFSIGSITKLLIRYFPAIKLNSYLGGMGLKMVGALLYVMPILFRNTVQQESLALFFVVNYLLYLSYSVVRIVKERY